MFPHDAYSHIYSTAPFLRALAAAGHNLTVFSSGNSAHPIALDIRKHSLHAQQVTHRPPAFYHMIWNDECHSFILADINVGEDQVLHALLDNHPHNFVNVLNDNFDLVLLDELFTVTGMTVASLLRRHRNVPYMSFVTSGASPVSNDFGKARALHPQLYPLIGTFTPSPIEAHAIVDQKAHVESLFNHKRFSHRLYNTLQFFFELVAMTYNNVWSCYTAPHKLGITKLNTMEVITEASLQLSEEVDRLARIVPQGMESRAIGAHCKPAVPLEGELLSFVEDSTSKGTIYIAFGSITSFDACPQFVFDALFGALSVFPDYRIVFAMRKLQNRTLPDLGAKVRFTEWAPQWALLNHPKTRVFMSHGGLKSFKEALCSETPAVFVPLFGEQVLNAQMAAHLGWGLLLSKFALTRTMVEGAFDTILRDPKYRDRVRRTKAQFLDRVTGALDEGVWLTEKLLRRKHLFDTIALPPTHTRPLLTFLRRGVELYSVTYFVLDWFFVLAGLTLTLSQK